MLKKYDIDKNVPLPLSPGRQVTRKEFFESLPYPFREMEPGDSFLVPMKDNEDPAVVRSQLTNKWVAWRKAFNCPDIKFCSKTVVGGLRVWRIK